MWKRQRPPLTSIHARRIAIIKPSALGDVVHAMPILGALRARFPEAQISWVVNRAYVALLEGHPHLHSLLTFDRGAMRRGLRTAASTSLEFAKQLRKQRFDLVIDLQCLARSALMTLATGARTRIGLSTAREGARYAYTDVVAIPNPKTEHAVDQYGRVAQALGVGEVPKTFALPVQPSAAAWAVERLRELPRPWLAFGVGARWITKRWLPDHFAELARRAQSQYGGTIVFVGAPDEAPLAHKVIAQLAGPSVDFVGKTSLAQLVAILNTVDIMVSNDTGPLHVAVALGRPTVAPYTCTNPVRHGPYGQDGGIQTSVWCKGSYVRTCDRMECMADLGPDRLWPYLSQVLSAWAHRYRSA